MTPDEGRPNPEDLLKAINIEEKKRRHGRLKIFLGMSAGVGKTYAMLESAQALRKAGVDVVVASIDSHGREETIKLVEGLKEIPEKWITYRDTVFEELDLDEILRIKPAVVLVDELAHSNVPGSRHPKRWQDVIELLEQGIDVYTTLNVQHIESLKDVVENVAGVIIRETVPDSIIETADYIEIIDITPDELLQRLKEGKVYFPEQSELAARNFFQPDRLTALREIVLRFAAKKLDHDLHDMISSVERPSGWKLHERLLVAVSPNLLSQRLIRTTRRLAFHLDAPWIALYVDDGSRLEDEEQSILDKNLSLARDLGGEVITTTDPDIAKAIERIARQKGVSQIVIGRSAPNTFFRFPFSSSHVDKLAQDCGDIDIHIIRDTTGNESSRRRKSRFHLSHLQGYGIAFLSVSLLGAINLLLMPYIDYKVIGFIFLLSIIGMSAFLRKGPILFASLLYALIWDYFFIPPTGSLQINSHEDMALLALYLTTAVVAGTLIDRFRESHDMLVKREESTRTLFEIVRDITVASSTEGLIKTVKEHLEGVLDGTVDLLIKDSNNSLSFANCPLVNDDKEKNALIWVFLNGKEAGWSTSTLPSAKNFYRPLKGFNQIVGVMIFRPYNPAVPLTIEEMNFLYTVSQQFSVYIERSFEQEKTRELEYFNQLEKTHQTILKLISEEFQSPLVNIQEAVKGLKEEEKVVAKKPEYRQLHKIELSSEKLGQILTNISAMAKLSTGLIPIHKEAHSIQELIEVAYDNVKKSMNGHHIVMKIAEDLPVITFDFYLLELLLYNLISNAAKYSPPHSTIEIEASLDGNLLTISVSDEGKGIPPEKLDTIFEKFYRLPGTTSTGIGLGLAIAKTIAEIHHGYLKAENRPGGGAKFTLYMPVTGSS
jgi:two-component system sensor histidine kinase KdpD